ncbi:MAG: PIN domain-containing protein [Anaeromyxobacteraceae bacterium]|nr:PIN domain-containing protein [Anaeromyxobacteraceae bacterium]
MTSPALICDASGLLEFLWTGGPDHPSYLEAIDSACTRYVPALVLAEVDHFLQRRRDLMGALLADLERGAFTLAPADMDLLRRARAIDHRYARLGLGLVDATIVALAERLGITRIATRDVRHFDAVTLGDGRRFDLVVRPTRRA